MLLSTSSLAGHGLHKIFSLAKRADIEGVNLDINPRLFDTLDAKYIGALIEEF
ncbi:MAG TPA: hypothetical protein PK765_02410 [bacterium]|nr:hypothetical protein [bacterium]